MRCVVSKCRDVMHQASTIIIHISKGGTFSAHAFCRWCHCWKISEPLTFLSVDTIDLRACKKGMRWPVEVILDLLGSEMTITEILEDHPKLEKEDIIASLNYAKGIF